LPRCFRVLCSGILYDSPTVDVPLTKSSTFEACALAEEKEKKPFLLRFFLLTLKFRRPFSFHPLSTLCARVLQLILTKRIPLFNKIIPLLLRQKRKNVAKKGKIQEFSSQKVLGSEFHRMPACPPACLRTCLQCSLFSQRYPPRPRFAKNCHYFVHFSLSCFSSFLLSLSLSLSLSLLLRAMLYTHFDTLLLHILSRPHIMF